MKLTLKTVLILLSILVVNVSMAPSVPSETTLNAPTSTKISLSSSDIDNFQFRPLTTLTPNKFLAKQEIPKQEVAKKNPIKKTSKTPSRVLPKKKVEYDNIRLIVTGYCKCQKCCDWKYNWRGRPVTKYSGRKKIIGQTATGAMAKVGTIAADTRYFKFGTKMTIPGYGSGVVQDRGGKVKGYHIDLYFNTHQEAKNWGRRLLMVKVKR